MSASQGTRTADTHQDLPSWLRTQNQIKTQQRMRKYFLLQYRLRITYIIIILVQCNAGA